MAHLAPPGVASRRRIRICEDDRESRRRLEFWTVDLQGRAVFGLGWLQGISQCHGILLPLLVVDWSNEAFWLEIIDDIINDVCFLQSELN